VLTLKAAGLVDIDAGEIVRPGILRIDGDRIAAVGGPAAPADEVVDLGSLILLPGLMGERGEPAHLSPGHLDPAMFNAMMPGLLPLSVSLSLQDGVVRDGEH